MAMAMPPRLMVLMVRPKALSVSMLTTSDKGMVTSEMTVVRMFMRKRKRMITTKMPPSTRASLTLFMELRIKRS